MKKAIIIPALVLSIFGLVAVGVGTAYANWFPGNSQFHSNLAQKLGVSEDKVKEAFDSMRFEHQKQMREQFENRLTQAVTDGKITEEQKQKIILKHNEIQSAREQNFDAWQSKTPEERHSAMQALHEELENWAEQNGIDPQYFFGGQMRPKGGMHGGWR